MDHRRPLFNEFEGSSSSSSVDAADTGRYANRQDVERSAGGFTTTRWRVAKTISTSLSFAEASVEGLVRESEACRLRRSCGTVASAFELYGLREEQPGGAMWDVCSIAGGQLRNKISREASSASDAPNALNCARETLAEFNFRAISAAVSSLVQPDPCMFVGGFDHSAVSC